MYTSGVSTSGPGLGGSPVGKHHAKEEDAAIARDSRTVANNANRTVRESPRAPPQPHASIGRRKLRGGLIFASLHQAV
ncbi:hypothetical protein MRX96_057939 [Rhipicephalus microplus]